MRIFFHKFTRLFSAKYFPIYCNAPLTDQEIERTMNIYRKLGLSGCIGSVDCLHIRWERCLAGSRSTHKGKEGFSTLSYEVTVDHTKKIIAAMWCVVGGSYTHVSPLLIHQCLLGLLVSAPSLLCEGRGFEPPLERGKTTPRHILQLNAS